MKARSRSQSATSASFGIENNIPMTVADWDNEQGSKIDFPFSGIRGVVPNEEYVYEESENSIEKNPVESVLSEDTDRFSDHTQYSHLAAVNPIVNSPTSLVNSPTSLVSGQGREGAPVFHHNHHQLNLPTSANSTESRGTPISFGEMVHNRLSAQSEDDSSAVNYATYV